MIASVAKLEPADLVSIQALIADYVLAVDGQDWERFARVWTKDAIVTLSDENIVPDAPLHGRDAIVAAWIALFERSATGAQTFSRHVPTPSYIETRDAEVRGTTVWAAVTYVRTGEDAAPQISRTGVWDDRFEQEAGRWLIAERLIAFDPPKVEAR